MKRVLIVGCGDVARRLIPFLQPRYQVYALTRRVEALAELRQHGVRPIFGDLDDVATLRRLAGWADMVLHLAPPPSAGVVDTRTRHLLRVLSRGKLPQRLVYISTSGVYGDCGGAWINECQPCQPLSARGQRRLDAEWQLRHWGRALGVSVSILRVPGIYAAERLPLERIRRGMPGMLASEDGYTNHIHADDLARIIVATLQRGAAGRVYHASDDLPLPTTDYFDLVADAAGLARVPRLSRREAQEKLPASVWSFLQESRRLENRRLREELRVRLRYPTLHAFLAEIKHTQDN